MLNVIIIDDEPKAILSLEWELKTFCPSVNIVATFSDTGEAFSFMEENEPDCLFLDIEMPRIDGFQFLELFPNRNFAVVVTTAYDHYAIKAIKEKALDYLLKPIDSDDLTQCVNRVKAFQKEKLLSQQLEHALFDIVQTGKQSKKISISYNGKIVFLSPDEIIYCESDGNYCTIYLESREKIFITQKLKYIEEKLGTDEFFRVHNSFLVNLDKVKEYYKNDGYLVLSNHTKIPVSRTKKTFFLNRF